MKHKLSLDISRCNGVIQLDNGVIDCPQRENCLRYLDREREHPWISFIIVNGTEQVGNCDSIIKND